MSERVLPSLKRVVTCANASNICVWRGFEVAARAFDELVWVEFLRLGQRLSSKTAETVANGRCMDEKVGVVVRTMVLLAERSILERLPSN